MQRYHTTTTRTAVPQDDKRLLLAVNQYRMELKEIGRLNPLEERRLADMARTGNKDAQAALIEHCLGYVYGMAWHYAGKFPETEVLDIAQAGNEAIVKHLPEALQARNVCAFLFLVARYAMIDHCAKDQLIPVPRASYNRGRRAPLTVSLFTPLSCDTDRMLLDALECADWQEAGRAFVPSSPQEPIEDERSHDPENPGGGGGDQPILGPEFDDDIGEAAA